MFRRGICPQRDRLLEVIVDLSDAYADGTMHVACMAGRNNHDTFQVAMKRAQELHVALQTARKEYELHLAQHGCKRGAASAVPDLAF